MIGIKFGIDYKMVDSTPIKREIKEEEITTKFEREQYLNQELSKFTDAGGVTFNFEGEKGEPPHLDLVYDFVRWYPSDINEHLPILRKYASRCNTVCEFGTNDFTSSIGLISGFPKHFISLDIVDPDIFSLTFEPFSPNRKPDEKPMVIKLDKNTINQIATINGVDFRFIQQSSLEFSFNSVDLLFIDTLHTDTQLMGELQLNATKVKKYIILHDTEFYGDKGQDSKDEKGNYLCPLWETKGIGTALREFVKNPWTGWVIDEHFENCNGLTILKRPWL